MEKEGFSRTIQFEGDANVYQLPTAEYNFSGEIDTDAVRDRAVKAAMRTGKKCMVVVTKADGPRSIHNLPVVSKKVS